MVYAEIERIERVTVKVDVARYCATYPDERATFDGTDEAFVKASIDEFAWDILNDRSDDIDGMEIEPDPFDGDIDVTIIGTVAA